MKAESPSQEVLKALCSYAMRDINVRRDVFAPRTRQESAFDRALSVEMQELARQLPHEQRMQLWDIAAQYQQLRQVSEWKGFKAGASLVLRLVEQLAPHLLTNLAGPDIIALLQTR